MRFHPESIFGKAWYAYYAANQLEKRSEEERREEYNKFSKEWKAPPLGRMPIGEPLPDNRNHDDV